MDFAQTYGPWAVIAGASEGTGRAFAREIAAKGIHCILIARREAPLQQLANDLQAEFGVEAIPVAVDLSRPDAHARIVAAVGEREVGLYVGNAGADPHGAHFLDKPAQDWIDLINRNVLATVRSCHHFAAPMRRRQRGGILLVGSGACYGGSSHMAVYAGSKAFEMCFAEGLWAELRGDGVDVLYFALGTTDTPAFREFMAAKGLPLPAGLAAPEEVARIGLARLPHGPIRNWGSENDEAGFAPASPDARRARTLAIEQGSKRIFGEG